MKHSLSTIDIITIVLASLALIISIITVIKQFFHKKLAFNACLIQYLSMTGAFEKFYCEYSIANTGNIELVVKEVSIVPVNPPVNVDIPRITPSNIPCLLKPGQMQMTNITIPARMAQKAIRKKFKIKLNFVVVSPNGKVFYVSYRFYQIMSSVKIHGDHSN
nr:hypothetical protein [uncultured Draconibacterium sp.]